MAGFSQDAWNDYDPVPFSGRSNQTGSGDKSAPWLLGVADAVNDFADTSNLAINASREKPPSAGRDPKPR